MATTQNTLATE